MAKGLPSEPARAIVAFADRVRDQIIKPRDKGVAPEKHKGAEEDFDGIAAFVLKFCEKYKLPVEFPNDGPSGYQFMKTVIERVNGARSKILSGSIDTEIDEILLEFDSGVGESFGLARLNSDEKKKIHIHIGRIRKIVEESNLSDRKKNALFARLNELTRETDSHGTRTDRFFAFMGDIAFVLGDMADKAKPLTDEVKDMIKTIGRSRARQEGVSLPPGDESLSLPSPEASRGSGE